MSAVIASIEDAVSDPATSIQGLGKSLREALKYLATQTEVKTLLQQLADQIELHKGRAEDPIELDLEPEDPMDWEEGVENLRSKTEDELYEMLGFKDRKIPFFVSEIDTETDIGAQFRENEDDTEDNVSAPQAKKQPFALKWHQLVGVTKMVQCALTSQPVLLMDDVGLGKTVQVLAFFAIVAYYRQFHSETRRYPGTWGKHITSRPHHTQILI